MQQEFNKLRANFAARLGISGDGVQEATVQQTVSDDQHGARGKAPVRDDDTHYFQSYAGHDIHQTMIADRVRTLSYAKFLLSPANAHLIRGKTVMDVGCGSGILSLLAARAGAARVLAVDASDVADRARANVESNGFGHVVRVFKGKVEELADQLAPWKGKVDLLVSEWMVSPPSLL